MQSPGQGWLPPNTFPISNYPSQSASSNSPRAKIVDTTYGKKLFVCNKEVPKNMLMAIRAVWLDKYSINKAALMFGVSQSTLWRYVGLLPQSVDESELRDFIAYSIFQEDEKLHKHMNC